MNILHMKYALEVAKVGSLNKAADSLLVAQPNISRSIKELEAHLGITIFDRSAKGMSLTPEGEEFITYAQGIMKQIEQIEKRYTAPHLHKQVFSVCAPRASYIAEAFAQFTKVLNKNPAEIFYNETNSQCTINNILNDDYKLGIIRYYEKYDKYFKQMFEEKGLSYEIVAEFKHSLLINRNSPLAGKKEIKCEDLQKFIEVTDMEPYAPSLPLARVIREELDDNIGRRIYAFERASQLNLMSKNPETFMWCSFISAKYLKQHNLILRECVDNKKIYKDVLIYKKGYDLTSLDKEFIEELHNVKKGYI